MSYKFLQSLPRTKNLQLFPIIEVIIRLLQHHQELNQSNQINDHHHPIQ